MEKFEEKFTVANKVNLGAKQFQVECIISTNGENLQKILALDANAIINNLEFQENEIKFTGEICTNLLFIGEENKINNLTSSCPFSDFFRADNLKAADACYNVKIISAVPTKVQDNQVVVLVTLEVTFTEFYNNDVVAFNPQNQDYCVQSDVLDVNVLADTACQTFDVESRCNIKENIGKILIVDSSAFVRDIKTAEGFVSVTGEVCTHIIYTTEDGTICKGQISEDFKEEIQLSNSKSNLIAQACLNIKKCDIKTIVETENENNTIVVTTPVYICVQVFENESIVVTKDVYGLKNEIDIITSQFNNSIVLPSKVFESKIEGNLSLEDNQPRIDKVLCVTPASLNVSNSYFNDGEIFVEGIVYCTVIYLNDEEDSLNSVELEIPFVVNDKLNIDASNATINVIPMLYDCDVMAKRGREIYFDCKLKVFANISYDKTFDIISSVEVGRTLPENDSAIEIFFAGANSTHWDIAKQLGISEAMLVEQNPSLPNPLDKDEKVVIYYGID